MDIIARPGQSPLDEQDSWPVPQAAKKKKKKGKIIAAGTGLEGFVDWVDPTNISHLAEEREDDMSSLVVGFAAWMHKREVSA